MQDQPIDPEAIDETFTPRVRDDIAAVEIDGEMLVFDESASAWHLLNPSAAMVWQIADGTASVLELAQDISSVLGVDLTDATAGVVAALRDFRARGLLAGVEPVPGRDVKGDHDHAAHGTAETRPPGDPKFIIDPPST
jgi:hypothetical protein